MVMIRTSVVQRVEAEIIKQGLRVERYGQACHVFGPGVDLIVADLGALTVANLKPEAQQPERDWAVEVRGSSRASTHKGNLGRVKIIVEEILPA